MIRALLVSSLAFAAPASAEVVATGETGFTVRHEAIISAEPAEVYGLLATPAEWWDPEHSYSGDAERMTLTAEAGGCFCESLPSGGSVEHLRVVYVEPGSAIRLHGGLGPLQPLGVAGAMSWSVEPAEDGARAVFEYTVGGFIDGGFDGWAAPVDSVVSGQLDRLKERAETTDDE